MENVLVQNQGVGHRMMNKIIFLMSVTIVGLCMFSPRPEREQPPGVLVDSVPFMEKVKAKSFKRS